MEGYKSNTERPWQGLWFGTQITVFHGWSKLTVNLRQKLKKEY